MKEKMKINAAVATEEQQKAVRPPADDIRMDLETNEMFEFVTSSPSCSEEQPGSPAWTPCQRSSPDVCRKHQTSQRCSSH